MTYWSCRATVLLMRKLVCLNSLFVLGLWFVFIDAVAGVNANGIYAIWYHWHTDILSAPYVKGGQVFAQWKDIEKKEGIYDFSIIDKQLRVIHEKGRRATVQVNGNFHPEYLYSRVPYLSVVLQGTQDTRGTLMYWHKNYRDAYVNFLKAYAKHLKESPYRSSILGIRLNYNAIGTEQFLIRRIYRNTSIWKTPTGVLHGANWSHRIAREYKQDILGKFVDFFSPEIKVFLRNDIFALNQVFVDDTGDPQYMHDQAMKQRYLDMIEKGVLWLFHTSSEIQPRNDEWGVQRFMGLRSYCRTSKTRCYAEPWTDSDRRYSDYPSIDSLSQEQWFYWRLLNDLNIGISFIAVQYGDLKKAENTEMGAALEFADKYAGYYAQPQRSPGAWIAFREGDYLQGDYTFLMERLPGDNSKPVSNIGPSKQRFGVWARRLDENDAIQLVLNEQFVQSLPGAGMELRITYYDKGDAEFDVTAFGEHYNIAMSGSKQWKVARFAIPAVSSAGTVLSPLIKIRAIKGDAILHMVELSRG